MPDEPLKITDRRHAARVRETGIVVARGAADVRRLASADSQAALQRGRGGQVPTDATQARQMGLSRLSSQRVASASTSRGNAQYSFATQRPRDPFFYWQQNNLPYDLEKEDHLKRLRELCRHIYRSHPVMASAIDVYSKWPMVNAEFECKDHALVDFYTTLMFDELDYEEYLTDIGREYWTVGEAWPLGSFNEDLGVWEDDELLNPDDVYVEKSPFLKDPHFYIRLPESLRKVLQTGQPRHEYEALMRSYPELKHFLYDSARMPVSNILLKQLRFKADTFNKRGIPILYRALRPLLQEEMLNSAQDSIADRLYTPLILAKIGASAQDLGTQNPWVPTEDQISDFEASLDLALAADFRVLTTHFAVQMESVFGRETMPNFDPDFDRLTEKQLQTFGLSKTMLSGAEGGQTYAADALNRDLISQLLTTYQRYIRKFVKDRMLVVAEAQEHYDYEVRGGKRYPLMEEVLIVDEETGDKHIVEQPKLLVPELRLQSMNMRDDEAQRQFYEALSASGVPISMKTRLVNVPIDFDDEVESTREEQVRLAVEAQKTRKAQYQALRDEGLPIPEDLKKDFEPRPIEGEHGNDQPAADPTRVPQLGLDNPDHSAIAPTIEQRMVPPGQPVVQQPGQQQGAPQGDQARVIPLPTNRLMEPRGRPMESDEQRGRMPKPGSLSDEESRMAQYLPKPQPVRDGLGNIVGHETEDGEVKPTEFEYGTLMHGPKHVGLRRHAGLDREIPIGEEPGSGETEEETG